MFKVKNKKIDQIISKLLPLSSYFTCSLIVTFCLDVEHFWKCLEGAYNINNIIIQAVNNISTGSRKTAHGRLLTTLTLTLTKGQFVGREGNLWGAIFRSRFQGVDDYLHEPIKTDELIKLANQSIERRSRDRNCKNKNNSYFWKQKLRWSFEA